MPRIALVNPNTNAATTAAMVEIARAAAPPDVVLEGITAESGAPLITNPEQLRTASDAVVALAPRLKSYDAVIVAAFGDPGRARLVDELSPIPVVGIGEASMLEAERLSEGRFAVAQTIPTLNDSIQQLAEAVGCGQALVSVRAPDAARGAVTRPRRGAARSTSRPRRRRRPGGS